MLDRQQSGCCQRLRGLILGPILGSILVAVLLELAPAQEVFDPIESGATGSGADPSMPESVGLEVNPEAVETIVVTGSRGPQALTEMPGAVEVVPGADIEASRYDGVVDVLRHIPGIHVDQPGARGSRASIYTRGLDPNHTVILLDGVVMNDPTNARGGSVDLSTLGVDDLERIEIVRGPLSAVHGSDAIAGAINIVTRRADGPDRARLDLSGGRWDYFRALGSVRGSRGPADLAVVGSWIEGGIPAWLGSYEGGNVYANGGVEVGEQGEVRGLLRFSQSSSAGFPEFSGGVLAPQTPAFEHREVTELSSALTYEDWPLRSVDYALWFTTNQRWEDRSNPGVPPNDDFDFVPGEPNTRDRFERYAGALRTTARPPIAGLSLTGGADVYYERGRSRGALDFAVIGGGVQAGAADFDFSRWVGAPFGEVHWSGPLGFTFLGGLRVDIPERESPELCPRVSGSWDLFESGVQVEATWGEGYKLPSFYALANPLAGNPNLLAERSRGWDAGLGYRGSGGQVEVSATYFDIGVDNLIDFDENTFRLQNIARARTSGVEFGGVFRPTETLEIRSHATYLNARNEITGARLRSRPGWRGGFEVLWRPTQTITTRLQALFVSRIPESSIPTGLVNLPGYERFDLAVSWQALPWMLVYLAIDNLTDQRYQEAVGFPNPGIRPRAGFDLRWPGQAGG